MAEMLEWTTGLRAAEWIKTLLELCAERDIVRESAVHWHDRHLLLDLSPREVVLAPAREC